MAPFYTGKGDAGDTGFLGSGRISKTSDRIEAIGSVDEATAALGMARALTKSDEIRQVILDVQKKLYYLMSELAADPQTAHQFDKINKQEVDWLEDQISFFENKVDIPREFILPGESPVSGALSLARAIVRRAERRVISLYESNGFEKEVLIAFLNRLSSLIFILEVYESSLSGHGIRLAKGG